MGTDLASMVVDVLTGTATGFGQQAASEIARMARQRLWSTPRGQAALEGLDAGTDGPEVRGEAEAVLREEIEADPVLRDALTVHVNASTNQATGIFMQGAKVRRSQISLGSITIHRPNTTAGLLGLAVALLVVVALAYYGGSQFLKEKAPRSSGGKALWARELSADEAERVIPGVSDLPGAWETSEVHSVGAGREGTCHSGWSDYDSTAKDAEGRSDLSVRFSLRTCPDASTAFRRYDELVTERDNPGSRKEFLFDTRRLGDESATTAYVVADEPLANPAQIGRHLMWRAYVGTVVIVMHYGPVREGVGSERQAEEFMRIVCDRALLAQPRR
ncbi:hypothetical protein OG730_28815 [Streptomyces sp. NBC_01298]|uniref:hypothetical protein n=1 Tax=Streptomyces sp. NBC_01298 TaxID=2903817 RepID=UPI002E0D1BD4|nr:hypothetical protein OG730_28815 [Streptomyces sp. NBC_01298]